MANLDDDWRTGCEGGDGATTQLPSSENLCELVALKRLCERSDTDPQISERLECVISNYEAQANDRTAWGSWMTSPLGKIHEEVWPSFQQRSMDLVNLALRESKAVTDRDQHKTSLQLDESQR